MGAGLQVSNLSGSGIKLTNAHDSGIKHENIEAVCLSQKRGRGLLHGIERSKIQRQDPKVGLVDLLTDIGTRGLSLFSVLCC
jgi:hypothetical protein